MDPMNNHLDLWVIPGLTEAVNNTAIRLGLAPFSGGDHVLLESDHGIIATRFVDNLRKALSKGWWFNTIYDYELMREDFDESERRWDLDFHVLRMETSRFNLNPLPNMVIRKPVENPAQGCSIVVTDEDWRPESLKVDLVVVPYREQTDGIRTTTEMPVELMEYIELKTTNQLAIVYGVPKDKGEELEALQLLHRIDGHSDDVFNVVDNNPLTWQTVRRR